MRNPHEKVAGHRNEGDPAALAAREKRSARHRRVHAGALEAQKKSRIGSLSPSNASSVPIARRLFGFLRPVPVSVRGQLSYANALGQFELIACDAVSVILMDEVVNTAPADYLAGLYADLCESPEFRSVSLRIESIPADKRGRDFLVRFTGAASPELPLELRVMTKKARIMEHWGTKIGGKVTIVER